MNKQLSLYPSAAPYPLSKRPASRCEPKPWSAIAPGLEPQGVELLQLMLVYDPAKRCSGKSGLEHIYFRELADGRHDKCAGQMALKRLCFSIGP